MKILIFSCLFICWALGLVAQQNGESKITRDTINLSGYVYNFDGTPCVDMVLRSNQKDTVYNLNNMIAITDKNGYFKLNGATFNDTISLQYYNSRLVYNKGSRFMIIYMPYPTQLNSAARNNNPTPYVVTAHRKYNKPTISFITKRNGPPGLNFRPDVFEMEPAYPGGMVRYKEAILKNISYPEKAIENNIEGTVEIGFTVLKNGIVSNYKILKGIGYGCDEEVIRAMKNIKKWKPGLMEGRPMEANFAVDIQFKLIDN